MDFIDSRSGVVPDSNVRHALDSLLLSDMMLSSEEKEAYLEACRRAPKLVDSESKLERFLLNGSCSPEVAAKKLVKYWQIRKKALRDKAFLPLIRASDASCVESREGSDECVLSNTDLVFLQSERIVVLPVDRDGCPVILLDATISMSSQADIDRVTRCLLCTLTGAARPEQAQENGIVLLIAIPDFNGKLGHVVDLLKLARDLVEEALPLRLKNVHILCSPTTATANGLFFRSAVPMILPLFLSLGNGLCQLHVRPSLNQMAERMESFGLLPHCLPTSLGGTFNDIGESTRVADYTASTIENQAESYLVGTQKKGGSRPSASTEAGPDTEQDDDEDMTPTTASATLSATAAKRPSKQPAKAKKTPKTKDERREYYRQRNALYSKRKYIRKKIEIDVLKTQCYNLEDQNRQLKRDGERLERFLAEAKKMVSLVERHSRDDYHIEAFSSHALRQLACTTAPESAMSNEALLASLVQARQQPRSFSRALSHTAPATAVGSISDYARQQMAPRVGQGIAGQWSPSWGSSVQTSAIQQLQSIHLPAAASVGRGEGNVNLSLQGILRGQDRGVGYGKHGSQQGNRECSKLPPGQAPR